ncbi:MAG: hypothetical protein E6R14_00645 [Thermomicrobiales bacterium]|nr:MAG: hypothetical protein E6R14_00645 [Thermomicrobiales bacterium]
MQNTHQQYDTTEHEHLDTLVDQASGKYPASGLILVGCADGRWFVEVDFGRGYDQIDGLSWPSVSPFVEPRYFPDRSIAAAFAFECIKRVHPELLDVDLRQYLGD